MEVRKKCASKCAEMQSNLSWHCSPDSQEGTVPCADVKRCWQQGQQLWQHSCARDACRYLVYHWCLLRCTFESRQPVLETKGKVKRQTTECFSACGYGGGAMDTGLFIAPLVQKYLW